MSRIVDFLIGMGIGGLLVYGLHRYGYLRLTTAHPVMARPVYTAPPVMARPVFAQPKPVMSLVKID